MPDNGIIGEIIVIIDGNMVLTMIGIDSAHMTNYHVLLMVSNC